MTAAEVGSLQADATEAYRRSPYPSLIHVVTHPDRLATVARLAGLVPPDVQTARVLEIGVADGLNLLAIAMSLPDAEFVGIEIEPEAVARGKARVAASGAENIQLVVADVLDGAPEVEGQFDYIIAHGVYAWVPEPVAEAVLALFAERLSPHGIGYLSFDALPGSYARMPVRDAVLRATLGLDDDAERVRRARLVLQQLATPGPNDAPMVAALRDTARLKLEGRADVMLHNELGDIYHPRYLADVLGQAADLGLRFVGDSGPERILDALLPEGETPADPHFVVAARACDSDMNEFRFFRRALLARDTAASSHQLDVEAVRDLYVSTISTEVEPNFFSTGEHKIRCEEPALVAALRRLIAAAPRRLRVRDLDLPDQLIRPLVGLFDFDIVTLHTVDAACAVDLPAKPCVSPLARVMIAEGMDWVASLHHRNVKLNDGAAQLVAQLDGSHALETVLASIAAAGLDGRAVLGDLARRALLMR